MESKKKKKTILIVLLMIIVVGLIYYFFFLSPALAFQKQEEILQKAGKRYFSQNSYLLPQEGKVREVRLSVLFDKKYIESMTVPRSKKSCSGEDSFVKVKKVEGKNQYFTYLSCGPYHSSTDHEGPQITLNGKENITVARGTKYKEEGVKAIRDNQDGLMDIKEVEIDSSKVNTSVAGTYEVTYTAYDSLFNKTVKKRKVRVVEKLATTINQATSKKGYYEGEEASNYLIFNAMLWRVVGFDEDGNITIVSNDPLANVDYSFQSNEVKGSSMDRWLNQYFYSKLSKKSKSYLVKNSKWCVDPISKDQLSKTDCKKTIQMNVGLLSIEDFNRSLGEGSYSYLGTTSIVQWLLNPSDEKGKGWTQRDNFLYDEKVPYLSYEGDILFGVRPALHLKKDVEVVSGDGSSENPFFLGDYETAKTRDLLNTRLSGEFVTYSGYLFRIVDTDKSGNTHVILDSVLAKDGEAVTTQYQEEEGPFIYNPTKKGNLGYLISNEMTQYINTNYFVKKKVTVPIYKDRALYEKQTDEKTYSVVISAPNTFDLFSARRNNSLLRKYWYINSSKNENRLYLASAGGTIYYTDYIDTSFAGVKISAYLDKSITITGGSGTEKDPYKIKK